MIYLFVLFEIVGIILTIVFHETHNETIGVLASSAFVTGLVVVLQKLDKILEK